MYKGRNVHQILLKYALSVYGRETTSTPSHSSPLNVCYSIQYDSRMFVLSFRHNSTLKHLTEVPIPCEILLRIITNKNQILWHVSMYTVRHIIYIINKQSEHIGLYLVNTNSL